MTTLIAAPSGVNWGTTNIPPEEWIDVDRPYRTRDGKMVINLNRVLHNSTGNEVTFPVKGTVVVREKPLRTEFHVWTLDGRADLFRALHPMDLVKEVGVGADA